MMYANTFDTSNYQKNTCGCGYGAHANELNQKLHKVFECLKKITRFKTLKTQPFCQVNVACL